MFIHLAWLLIRMLVFFFVFFFRVIIFLSSHYYTFNIQCCWFPMLIFYSVFFFTFILLFTRFAQTCHAMKNGRNNNIISAASSSTRGRKSLEKEPNRLVLAGKENWKNWMMDLDRISDRARMPEGLLCASVLWANGHCPCWENLQTITTPQFAIATLSLFCNADEMHCVSLFAKHRKSKKKRDFLRVSILIMVSVC